MSGKYLAYPEYKKSNVVWLGNVPKHWELTRIKYISDLTPKKPDIQRNLKCSFIPMEKLKTDSIILDETRVIDDVYDGYTYFKDSDILMAKVTPCFENKNIAVAKNLVNSVGFGSSEIYVIRVKDKTSNRFLYYRLQEDGFMDIATAAMTGAGGLKRVPSEVLNNFIAALPDVNEQQKIANFLDHETNKIDILIEKQQQLIKLLKEKRQAVISHAVTKGLNSTNSSGTNLNSGTTAGPKGEGMDSPSSAPMRDSGVEWLGEVPEHWEVKRIKHFGKIIGGYAFKSDDFIGTGVRAIKIANVSHLSFDWSESSYLPNSFLDEQRSYILPKNSLVFAMTRPIISGGVKVAKFELNEECLVNQRVGFLKPSAEINQDYLMYVAQSKSFFCAFENNCTVTNQPNISSEGIEDIRFAYPNIDEQQEVVNYIKHISTLIEDIITKGELQVELLQERRTALISAAVTGKIDVRNWQPPPNSRLHGDNGIKETAA